MGVDSAVKVSGPLAAALDYARRDWRVLPVRGVSHGQCSCGDENCSSPGKHPHTLHGVKDATTDEAVIRSSWGRWPDANVGIATGQESGVIVVDLDGPVGEQALAELLGELPVTPTAITGKGRHLFFACPDADVGNRVRLLPGVDIRGEGGYVVVPPSIHHSGRRYRWDTEPGRGADVPLAPLPEPLLSTISGPHGGGVTDHFLDRIAGVVEEGQRNNTLAQYAGFLLRKGVCGGDLRRACRQVNAEHFRPPLDDAELLKVVQSIEGRAAEQAHSEDGEGGAAAARPKHVDLLLKLAAPAELFHTPDGEAYATFPIREHRETWPVQSRGLSGWLRLGFYRLMQTPPGAQAVADALNHLEAAARIEGPEHPVHVRVGGTNGAIYVDLCDADWKAVEITGDRWRIVDHPPVRFRRAGGMAPLPRPLGGGSLDALRPFVNVAADDWVLLLAWAVAACRPTGPFPIFILQGEQGSAKSTLARVLRALLDPSTAPLRSVPRDERDLVIAASNSWVLPFDNLAHVTIWLSDAYCRLATGGGFTTRKLYTDREEVVFTAQRPIIFTGIEELASRDDLRDRAIILNLPPLRDERRRDEKGFWRDFDAVRPGVLGALFDAVSQALRNYDATELPDFPRMADFARWAVAAEPALGVPQGAFIDAYLGNRAAATELTVEFDPVAQAVRDLAHEDKRWEGTSI